MINIESVTLKNFLSVGAITQSINFNSSDLTLIVGENLDLGESGSGQKNGVGKTGLVQAISYALYGQALNTIKKDNLINKINNKQMLVTLCFEKDNVKYRIERGRRPNILKLYVDNIEQTLDQTDQSQGDSRETQHDLTNLLGMSYDMFKHIIALNTYTEPFLSMRSNDQRMIIEQLLGITLLSEKADKLKEQNRKTKEQVNQELANIEAVKSSNERIQQSINSLMIKSAAWNKQQAADVVKISKSIDELSQLDIDFELSQHELLRLYNDQTAKLASLSKQQTTVNSALMQSNKSVKKYSTELDLLSNQQCHACHQKLKDHLHEKLTLTATQHLQEAVEYCEKLKAELALIESELINGKVINDKPKTYYKTSEQALEHRTNLNNLEHELLVKDQAVDPYIDQINELSANAIQTLDWTEINELNRLKDHQEFLLKLLTNKDSFIRKKIIDQNLSYLNNRLTYYLNKIGLPHCVVFQNDLSVEITQLGKDYDFHNLSRGEMNRLIISLSFAFRDLWENLYSHVNLLFVDEIIDSGLDISGVESSLALLKQIARDRKKNVYLISHKEELVGRVDSILKAVKFNGFTTYEIEGIS